MAKDFRMVLKSKSDGQEFVVYLGETELDSVRKTAQFFNAEIESITKVQPGQLESDQTDAQIRGRYIVPKEND